MKNLIPFSYIATAIFFLAIVHALLTTFISSYAHKHHSHLGEIQSGILSFLGEIEVVFGLWTIPLAFFTAYYYNWQSFVDIVESLSFTEPMFVIVIMTIAGSRPIVKGVELFLWQIVKLVGGRLEIWWFIILTLGPLLGSLITEPAAMVLCAMLLADKFYDLNPPRQLKYSTLALLLINISIGGTLTSFAAPPVLMIADKWQWTTSFMFTHIGYKAILAILINNTLYYFINRRAFKSLEEAYKRDRFKKFVQRRFVDKIIVSKRIDELELLTNQQVGFISEFEKSSESLRQEIEKSARMTLSEEELEQYQIDVYLSQRFDTIKLSEMKRTIPGLLPDDIRPKYNDPDWDRRDDKVPMWIIFMHLVFMCIVIINDHQPVIFIGTFMFYIGFIQITSLYQNRLNLKPALMVAFFLAGLIIHSHFQAWWIEPLLSSLSASALNLCAIVLTSFNDNAAITYLSSLVEGLSDELKYAIVTGAVTGGGLTLIANAPNPISQSILKKYFKFGISPRLLLLYAAIPTVIVALIFKFL